MKSAFSVRRGIGIWSCTLAVFFFGLAGCASAPPKTAAAQQSPAAQGPEQAEKDLWKEGVRAFEEGDYGKARAAFELLGRNASSAEVSRRVLYALAAVRLATAQTPEEYGEGVALWMRWTKEATSAAGGEDPAMLTPFLLRLTQPGVSGALADPGKKSPREPSAGDMAACKGLLKAKEKEADTLKAKLDAKEKEVRRLRHQLQSLEEIHRKYQEKKQEASSP